MTAPSVDIMLQAPLTGGVGSGHGGIMMTVVSMTTSVQLPIKPVVMIAAAAAPRGVETGIAIGVGTATGVTAAHKNTPTAI